MFFFLKLSLQSTTTATQLSPKFTPELEYTPKMTLSYLTHHLYYSTGFEVTGKSAYSVTLQLQITQIQNSQNTRFDVRNMFFR